MEWQWHQLDHMQIICTSFLTDNHGSISSLNFYTPDALPDAQPTVLKHWRQCQIRQMMTLINHCQNSTQLGSHSAECRAQRLCCLSAERRSTCETWGTSGTRDHQTYLKCHQNDYRIYSTSRIFLHQMDTFLKQQRIYHRPNYELMSTLEWSYHFHYHF